MAKRHESVYSYQIHVSDKGHLMIVRKNKHTQIYFFKNIDEQIIMSDYFSQLKDCRLKIHGLGVAEEFGGLRLSVIEQSIFNIGTIGSHCWITMMPSRKGLPEKLGGGG